MLRGSVFIQATLRAGSVLVEASMDDRDSYREGMSAYHAGRYEDVIRLLTSLACEGEGVIRLMARFYLGQAHHRLALRLFTSSGRRSICSAHS